jgi:hypothetical protein
MNLAALAGCATSVFRIKGTSTGSRLRVLYANISCMPAGAAGAVLGGAAAIFVDQDGQNEALLLTKGRMAAG